MQKLSGSRQRQDGLTLMDLQTLPPQQKQIINWIRQQGNCSLLDIAVHFCQDEETIFARLYPLVQKGFLLQEFGDNNDIYFQVKFAPKRPRRVPAELLRGEPRESETEQQD